MHRTPICAIQPRILAFIQHNLYGCPQDVKEKCLNVLVRPILKYRGSVWDPHQAGQIANLKNTKKGQLCL